MKVTVDVIVTYELKARNQTDMNEAIADLKEEVRTKDLCDIYGIYHIVKKGCRIGPSGFTPVPTKRRRKK
jgi:hypothetical protein